jgi:hypothetical protein
MSEAVVRAWGRWGAARIPVLPPICERTSLNLVLAIQRNSTYTPAGIAEKS